MKAASQRPSAVRISTSRSTVSGTVAAAGRLTATRPAAADSATKFRRDRSSGAPGAFLPSLFRALIADLPWPRSRASLIDTIHPGWACGAIEGDRNDWLRDTGHQ